MHSNRSSFFGKYRALLLAIGIFFVVTVSIFSFNYALSVQLAVDGARVKDSGAIRGLTQQHAKAILSLSHEIAAGDPIQTSQAQISESSLALDDALARSLASAKLANVAAELELLAKFEKFWRPLADISKSVDRQEHPDPMDVQAAFAKSNNVRLMQLADDLTQQIESAAAARTKNLGTIQTVAIGLALASFLFIVFYTLRSLRRSDRVAELARAETEQIMATVREGLFLIDRNGVVGSQRSKHLEKVFPGALPPGADFWQVLASLVSDETLKSASEYIGLLFNKRVKVALVKSLNPLQRVEIMADEQLGKPSVYLSFDFHPVFSDREDGVAAVLVSAVDVSQQVALEQELELAEQRSRTGMGLLGSVLENDPAVVGAFLAGAEAGLGEINEELRRIKPGPGNYNMLINRIFRIVHATKGEAAALALHTVSQQAHRFEDVLSSLRKRLDLRGEDLIAVATGSGELLEELSKVRGIVDRLGSFAGGKADESSARDEDIHQTLHRIQRLTLAVAADLGKKVRVETSLAPVGTLPDAFRRLLTEGLPQLVRNAVAHGIESGHERLQSGKSAEGSVRIEVRRSEAGVLELEVADDGRGIDAAALRRKLVASGRYQEHEVAAMAVREVIATIFQPGMSTADQVNEHAGRGVGLDVLHALVRETGARIKLISTPSSFTRFILQWSPAT
jgi:HPt (histidine-containing phosphotransfer) domain-containing protein